MKPEPSQIHTPGLYLVATPIGNLKDITLRALDVLRAADLVVCEDTRVTSKLLTAYDIRKPTLSYNDHNGEIRRPKILALLQEGKCVALVSDAGTPLVSDPGYKLVRAALADGIYVTALPGASSVLTALCLSGLPANRFFFAGFLPVRKEACRKAIELLVPVPATLVIFEAARRLPETLARLEEAFGDREAAVVREISKRFEETRRAPLSELTAHYKASGAPKGEVVIIVAPPAERDASAHDIEDVEDELHTLLASHGVKEASSLLAKKTGRPRKEIYALALRIRDHEPG